MPTRKAIVTVRKLQLAFLIKAGDTEAVQAGKLFDERPITSREQADAEFLAQLPDNQLQAFLYSKQVLKVCIHVQEVHLKTRRKKMSTNAAIGLTMPDGTIKAVHLHWDGYIAHGGAGETLEEHYKDREKVKKLIALGFLSSLGAEVAPDPASPHSWKNPQPNVTVAYHRDRNDPLEPAIVFKDKDSFAEEAKGSLWAEYAYLFEDGRWLVCDLHLSAKPWKWTELTDVLAQTGQD